MTISIDDELKEDFSAVCREIGLSPSAAFGVFAKAVVREKGIPFDVSALGSAERAARESEQRTAQGIWNGYNNFQEGRSITREESKKMREANKKKPA